MKQLNEKLYINEDNIQGVQKIDDTYFLTTTNGNNIVISESLFNELKEYEGGGGSTGSSVVANPTLVGNEDSLTGLEVDGTKYAVSASKQSYLHNITITNANNANYVIRIQIENDSNEAFDYTKLRQWLNTKGFNAVATNPQYYKAIGNYSVYGELCDVVGIADNDGAPNALWLQGTKKDGSAIQTGQLGSNYRFNDVIIPK